MSATSARRFLVTICEGGGNIPSELDVARTPHKP